MLLHLDIEFLPLFFSFAHFVCFSRYLLTGKNCERCEEACHYVIQLVVWVRDNFLNLKHVLIISSFA